MSDNGFGPDNGSAQVNQPAAANTSSTLHFLGLFSASKPVWDRIVTTTDLEQAASIL